MDPVWTIVALLGGAAVLLLLEIFTPTFGLLAILGVASLVGAAWMAYLVDATFGILMGVGILVVVPAYLVFIVKYLPNTRFGRMIFLAAQPEPGKAEGNPDTALHDQLVGHEGLAETPLRPAGSVRVDGRRIDAMAESGLIEKGERIVVVRVSGPSCVVRKVEPV